jgi:hypothetical protein
MKVITKAESLRKADFSFDATLSPAGSGQGASHCSTEGADRLSDCDLPLVTAKRTR